MLIYNRNKSFEFPIIIFASSKNIYLFDIRLYSLTQGLIINVNKHISECCSWYSFLILNAMYYKKEINSKAIEW